VGVTLLQGIPCAPARRYPEALLGGDFVARSLPRPRRLRAQAYGYEKTGRKQRVGCRMINNGRNGAQRAKLLRCGAHQH